MTRETSISAYYEIKNNGLLKGLQFIVYETLLKHGPMTQAECCKKINDPKTQDRSFMPRFAELEKLGVIKETRKRTCSITGRVVLEWNVTDKIPIKFDRPKSLKVQIIELESKVKSLEQTIKELKEMTTRV